MENDSRWLTTAQAAALLGVKPATVYAYVSRGLLTRHPGPDQRSSAFERTEVRRLAARSRHGGRAGALDVVLDTELSLLDPAGALYYRGRHVPDLARTARYEEVAELLWDAGTGPWTARPAALAAGRGAQAALPADTRPADRLRVTAAVVAATDPLRHDRRPAAVADTGRALIAALVDCLPPPDRVDDTGPGVIDPVASLARRLWPALAGTPPTAARLRALNAALILSTDHELATSALATRVAASVRADPYLTVLAGLATAGGALHGGAVSAVEAVLAELAAGAAPAQVVGARLAAGNPVPGFAHIVYTDRDPRADALLPLVDDTADGAELDAPVAELIALAGRHGGPAPNIDLALGVLAARCGFVPGAAEAVFLIGRTAGLIGHTIEEYRHRFRFRPRAVYTGQRPTQ